MDLLRSLPIGLYLEQPVTWLHRIDPRVKLGWLLAFSLTPIGASPYWRLSVVGWLFLITLLTRLPFRAWRRQMGLVLIFSLLLFAVSVFAPDGLTVPQQPRLPAQDLVLTQATTGAPTIEPVPALPQPMGYEYVLVQQGAVRVTRRSLDLALRLSTLVFTLIYSTNLYLLTTAPEEITAGLDDLMQPLRRLGVPVTELILTLTLSLRFIPLVLEEIQNLVRSVRTRAINWKKLGFKGSSQIWLMISERLLDNLLTRAEQIASAMQVRGFTAPNAHRVLWHELKLTIWDFLLIAGMVAFWAARILWGGTTS